MILDFIAAEVELYQRLTAPVEEKHKLSSMELAIILFLANNPNHDTATEIVNIRHLTKSHVSTSIRSLEEKGLLFRFHSNGDRKTVHLALTDKSNGIVADGKKAQSGFYDILKKGFSADEITAMTSFLERMSSNVSSALMEE